MNKLKRFAAIGAAATALAANALIAAPSASANSYNGCGWPRVCFYSTFADWHNGTPTAAYRDYTSYFQNLGFRSRGADKVNNTRNDDRAWLRYVVNSTGQTRYLCLAPNHNVTFRPGYTVTGIRIDTQAYC